MASAKSKKPAKQSEAVKIVAYKGFEPDLTCRGFKFEVGQTYTHDGVVLACSGGFHACEGPLDVWGYYPITNDVGGVRRFAEVECSGDISRNGDKIASASITIKAELSLPQFLQRGVDWILSRVDFSDARATNTGYQSAATNTGYQSAATNTGDRSAATNTGYRSAATNTGYRSAATNTGYQSAATNTGYRSAATNTGDQSAATNTGDQSAATNTGYLSAATNTGYRSAATNTGDRSAAIVEGQNSVAMASGIQGRAAGADGCALFLVERDTAGKILNAWAGIVGRDGIKAGVFYTLRDGLPVEA